MEKIEHILGMYKIEKAFYKITDNIEIIIEESKKELSMDEWISLIREIKYFYKKDVEFLTNKKNYNLVLFNYMEKKYE